MRRVTAPVNPRAARARALRERAQEARDRPRGQRRTPQEVDETLDLILARLADLED